MIWLFKKILDFIQPFTMKDDLSLINTAPKSNVIIAVSYADTEAYAVELINNFLSKVFTTQFLLKCFLVLIISTSLFIFCYILPLYLYRRFFKSTKKSSFYSFCRHNMLYIYVKYLNQQYVIEELSVNFLLFYRFYSSIGILIFISTGSFIVLGSYFLFLLLNGLILFERVLRKENCLFWILCKNFII